MGKKGKKGKKNAQPPPLPELSPELTESLCKIQALQRGGLCRLQLRKAKERTATELLDEVLTLAWRQIRSHVLETKKARFAAETVLSQMNRVVAWNNFCYEESPLPVSAGDDTSPRGVAPSKPSHAWTFERQAQGVKVDRHSRYEVFAQPPTPPKIMRPKTPTSAKSHSGRGGSGRATTPGSSRRTGFKNGKRWESDGMEEAVEVVDLSDLRGHHNSKPSSKEGAGGLSGEDLLLSMMTPTEREYHFKMKAEAAERVRIATLEAEREELARAKAEEWEKRMREVAGKQWTVDADGTVIIVAPPKEKELGPHALPVKSTIKAGAFASPPPPEASRGGTITTMAAATTRSTEENGGGGGSGAHAVVPTALAGATGDTATAGNGATAAAHFLKSVEVQPNLGEDRRFLPADGVELSALSPASGGKGRPQVKAGRAYQSPENRLTRVEYRRRIGFELPESDDRTKASGLSTLESDSLEGASVGSAAGGARKTARSVPPSKRFPIIDPLQGGRKRSALKSKGGRRGAGAAGEPPTAGSKEERDLRGGGGVTDPSEGPEETSAAFGVETDGLGASEEAEKAKELERIHAMNREAGTGMRGSPVQSTVPAMSSGLQRPRALPHKHKDMRGVINSDHFPVGAIPTAYREKLAAPTKLGVVTGHGDATLPLPSSSKVSQGGDDEGGGYLDGKNIPTAAEISPQKGGLGSGSAPLGQTLSRVTIPEEIQEQRLHYDIGMSSTGRRRGSTRGSSKGNPS